MHENRSTYVNNLLWQFTCSLLIMVYSKDQLSLIVTCYAEKGWNWYSDCKRISLCAINLAKIHKLVFEISCLYKTWLHTDTTQHIVSRLPTADGLRNQSGTNSAHPDSYGCFTPVLNVRLHWLIEMVINVGVCSSVLSMTQFTSGDVRLDGVQWCRRR